MDGYVLDKAVLSDEEKAQILLGIKTISSTGGVSDKALSKLRAIFSIKNTDWTEVDFSRWSNPAHDRKKFDVLKNAVIRRNVIVFYYPNANGELCERKACPLKLVFQGRS